MGKLSCRIYRPRAGARKRCYSNTGERRMKQLMRNMTLDLKAGAAIQSLWLVMHALFLAFGSSYSPWHFGIVFVGTWPKPLNLRRGAVRPKKAAPVGTRWKRVKDLRCLVWSFDSCVSSEKVCLHKESEFKWVSCGACVDTKQVML